MARALTNQEIAAAKNRLCKPQQYRLWVKDRKIWAVVRLICRVAMASRESDWDVWFVENVGTGGRHKLSTSVMGKILTDMEVLAWVTELPARER